MKIDFSDQGVTKTLTSASYQPFFDTSMKQKSSFFHIKLISFFLMILFVSFNGFAKEAIRPHDRAVYHNNQGVSFLNKNEIDKAIFEFKTALEISPEYIEAWNNLGLSYKMKRDYSKAIDALSQAVKINKQYSGAWTSLASVYINIGNYPKAIEAGKKAIAADKKYADAYYNIGMAYKHMVFDQGRREYMSDAIDHFRKATDANPNHYYASIELGNIYLNEGKYEDALIRFKVAVETNPNSSDAWLALSQVYQKQGNPAKAQEALSRALSIQPNNAQAHLSLSAHYVHENNFALAEEELKRAKEMEPLNPDVYFQTGLLNFKKGDAAKARGALAEANAFYQLAVTQYRKVVELDSHQADGAYNLGYSYYRLQDRVNAKDWFQKALKINPAHYRAMYTLGLLEGEMGNQSTALSLLCRFNKEAPASFNPEKKQISSLVSGCK